MTELYAFLFCLGLGVFSRGLYMSATWLAKRTDLLPVTVVLDALTALTVGAAFTLYVILTGTPLAPYMFAATLAGYYITYMLTSKSDRSDKDKNKSARSKRKKSKREVDRV